MKGFLSHKFFAVVTTLMLLAAVAFQPVTAQQEEWMTKNIDQWNKTDVETILNKSAWVKTQEVRIPFQGQRSAVAGAGVTAESIEATRTDLGGAHIPIDFIFTLRLRSALPIRLALIRQLQIESNYDTLGKEQRSALDAKLKGLYTCPACADNYVLTLSSKSNNYPGADAVFSSLKGARLEDLKRFVYLMNDQGEKRALAHFTPPKAPGEEATFFFSRFDEQGRPLITPTSKEIIFRLADKDNGATTNFIINVPKLIVGGQVIF